MWLGPKRRQLTDWITQLRVKSTSILIDLQIFRWLEGPIARPTIVIHFFDDFAAEHGLSVQPGNGLIKNLAELSGPAFKLAKISQYLDSTPLRLPTRFPVHMIERLPVGASHASCVWS
jgi:hypothetical protein